MSAQSAIFNPSQTTSAATGDGFSCPRVSTGGRLAIPFGPNDRGMMVYDVTLNNLFIWNGSAWESVPASGDAGADGSVQYNDNGVVSGAANLQYNKASGFTSLRSGSALRAYVADNSVYSTITDNGAAGGLTIDNLNSDGISLRIGSVNAYTLSSGVATWYDGSGNTRMTLNSTGLGVGISPSYKVHSVVTSGYAGAFKSSTAVAGGILCGNTVGDLIVGVDASGNGRVTADTSKYLGLGSNGINDRVILDSSGNVGIGVTPSAWATYKAVSVGGIGASVFGLGSSQAGIAQGAFFNNGSGSGWAYSVTSQVPAYYLQINGEHRFHNAVSGTAGAQIASWTQAMTLDASGNLLVGTTTSPTGTKVGAITKLSGVSVEGTAYTSVSTTPVAIARPIGTGGLFFVAGFNASGGAQGWWLVASTGASTATVIASGNNTLLTVAFTQVSGVLNMNTTSGTLSVTTFAITN